MKIFSGSSNKPLAEKIAKELDTSLSSLEIHIFPDGERRVRVLDKVLEEDCIVVQSCSFPVDQNYMELFFIVDALKRSGAKSVTAVVPYLGYQRQDHIFRDGEAVSLEVIIKIIESMGVSKIVIFDPHTIRTKELFHIPVVDLSALELFAEQIRRGTNQNNTQNIVKDSSVASRSVPLSSVLGTVLVSPDMGGIRRIKILSEMLGIPFATLEKNRDLGTGEVSIESSEGLNNFKRAIIVDDMISSGKTIDVASNFLKEKGVEEIFVFATHAVFSNKASKILSENKIIKSVFITDSVDLPKNRHFSKLQVISLAQTIANALK